MKILILRFSSIGDILLATPVLDVLRSKFPGCEIDWIVKSKFGEVLSTNPMINKLMLFKDKKGLKKIRKEIKSAGYDYIFDLHRNSISSYLTGGLKNVFGYEKRVFRRFMLVHFKMAYKDIKPVTRMYFTALEKAGIETSGTWKLRFGLVKDTEVRTVNKYNLHNTNYVLFVPGASYATKMWPKEYFRELAQKISGNGNLYKKIMIIGKGAVETDTARFLRSGMDEDVIDLTDKLSLQETAAVVKFADIVVTNDNGPMHLAECFGKKILALFGSTTEEFGFFPYSTVFRVMEDKTLKCRPCTHFGRKKCPKGHFKCMNNITPDEVYDNLIEMLND